LDAASTAIPHLLNFPFECARIGRRDPPLAIAKKMFFTAGLVAAHTSSQFG
jgi:hypothetical protein